MEYLRTALYVYDKPSKYAALLDENEFGTICKQVGLDDFLSAPHDYKSYSDHLLVACSAENLHLILQEAVKYDFSLGILPDPKQKKLIRAYDYSTNYKENIELSLRDDLKSVDLIYCNGEYCHIKVRFGDTPLIDSVNQGDGFFENLVKGIQQFFKFKLFAYDIKTANDREINTAASGLIITNHVPEGIFVNRSLFDTSMRDGQMGMVIVSPFSILKYFKFLASILRFSTKSKKLPDAISFVKSEKITISNENIPVVLDGVKQIVSPVVCEIKKDALRFNAPESFWQKNEKHSNEKEVAKVANLPDEKERTKYLEKRLTFFGVASTERFKELFQILRDDAKLNSQYLVLMFLSTVIAAIGLFANSAAVVIGAMVLAPLMTPIVAFAMGLLRGENEMLENALYKIGIGVLIAISASALMAVLLPQVELTGELKARINPTLLDLGVAVFSGIAAAYSKTHRSIRESLAGVAIAVALVPPLATAGIGLGRGEFYVFYGAFLLFFTNLIGIALAASVTFYFQGFSNAVKNKKSFIVVSLLLAIVSYPLYLSYTQMLHRYTLNKALSQERFLIDDKYIIIRKATVVHKGDVNVVRLKIMLRDTLNRKELELLKKKIQNISNKKIYLQIETEYIL